ncbi:MAG: ergothioneine biosynthesis protein EgtB, partial [Flavobacteriales bacterium]|nr:ergothioneine biosynthesis protein EgtB [Flavobacteriales bacterium]
MDQLENAVTKASLKVYFEEVRERTVELCAPLQIEDYIPQPVNFVSPPKWHLGHTTWFYEEFILSTQVPGYERYSEDFAYVFNSYYNTVGKRVLRADRGNMTRPT